MGDLPNLTCDVVRRAVEADGHDWMIAFCGSPAGTQLTTWGRTPEQKVFASAVAMEIADIIAGPNTKREIIEHFQLDAAKNKARVEELEVKLAECRSALELVRTHGDYIESLWGKEGVTARVLQAVRQALEASK